MTDSKSNKNPAADPKAAAKPQGVMIVTCSIHRRRAGRAFGPEPVEIKLSDLTKDERAAIEGDKALSVKVYE